MMMRQWDIASGIRTQKHAKDIKQMASSRSTHIQVQNLQKWLLPSCWMSRALDGVKLILPLLRRRKVEIVSDVEEDETHSI